MGDKEVHGKVFTIHVLVNLVPDSLKKMVHSRDLATTHGFDFSGRKIKTGR